jgi:2-polyprenyl-3-methyl-5-hydroxy-6-metoxy-1,4-benzoquinol methylase
MATTVDTDRIVHRQGYTMQALQQLPEKHIGSPERKARVLSTASVLSSPYDRIAPWYDEGIRRGGSIHDLVLPGVLELIGNVRGIEICDLACGQGILARRLAGQGSKVVGVDLSLELLKIAEREEQSEPLGITYLQDDAQHLHGLANATFDGVVCNLALMDIANLSSVAYTIQRILRPGGWFVFAIIHPCAPVSSPEGILLHAFHDYFEESFWCSSNLSSVRGRVGAYHRTLSTYLNSFLTVGLVLERVMEPQATGPFAASIEGYDRVPVVFIAQWRKGISR